MKKYKIIFFALVLSFIFVGCNANTETKTEQPVEETKLEINTVEEVTDNATSEDTPDTTVETVPETQLETKEKSINEFANGEVIEIKDTQKDGDNVSEIVNIAKSNASEFNNEITKELQAELSKLSVTLVTINGLTYDQFPEQNLQAIAKYKDSESYGWVVRYGQNKIGLAQIYNSSTTGVLVMFDGRTILEINEDVISNDSAEEFKSQAEKIIQKQISGDAEISYGY